MQKCETINEGCLECSYDEDIKNYPENYYGIKRKRRFLCKNCAVGYKEYNGWCFSCSSLFSHCEDCEEDINTKNYKCTKCSKPYFINKYGYCEQCIVTKAILNNKCIECGDDNNGGVKNCVFCQEKENRIYCKQFKEGIYYHQKVVYKEMRYQKILILV